jgi:hypothetical protein
VKAGWLYIIVGVGMAVIFQHLDAIIFGGIVALVGVWILAKEKTA